MSIEQYKRCNDCGAKNELYEEMCIECFGTSFSIVSNTENSTIAVPQNNVTPVSKNGDFQEDKTIIDNAPKVLKLIFDGMEKEIYDNDIIGREGICTEMLQDNKKISRRHARFCFIDDVWHVEDLNSTNGTFVNNVKILSDEKIKIVNGSELKFSSTLLVRVLIEE